MTIVSVFGSSMIHPESADYIASQQVGHALAIDGYTVMTGGYGGVMEAASRGANEAGGEVIGVTCEQVKHVRPNVQPNQWVKTLVHYDKLDQRLDHLINQAEAYVIMPGGVGTLNELVLAWEYMRLGEIPVRPLICYGDIWERTLKAFIDDRYVPQRHQSMVMIARTPSQVISLLNQART